MAEARDPKDVRIEQLEAEPAMAHRQIAELKRLSLSCSSVNEGGRGRQAPSHGQKDAILKAGCWCHARRHHCKAVDSNGGRARPALALIRKLFKLERD